MPQAKIRPKLLRSCTSLVIGVAGAAMVASQGYAQEVPQQPAATARPFVDTEIPEGVFSGKRSRDVFLVQVLLDRAHFSPGEIDGYSGGNTTRAVKAWQRAKGIEASGQIDATLISALKQAQPNPVIERYSLTDADLAGPFGALPSGMVAMAEVKSAHYESAVEGLAEKFHMSQDALRALNPGIEVKSVGDDILVAATGPNPIDGIVTRIEIDSAAASLRAYGNDGELLASFPATVGSADFPSPNGKMEVRTLAPAPAYYFSPEGRNWGPDKKLTIAPGPNNPVGSTWIDLTKEGYGVHGTPDPQNIGKTASHGCVRLTNWDAHELGKAIEAGTKVDFL
ncbi:MAG: L,D-transpeptidase family protein [Sphingomicrobium sp.]